MDEKKIEEELKKIWEETSSSHSDYEKELSWEAFHSKTFSSKRQKFRLWHYSAVAAAVLIFALIGTGVYFNNTPSNANFQIAENVIKNTTPVIKTIVLPDSSRVELSPNSRIIYENNFALNRNVQVIGEAYFKVKKDKKHPFQVACNETTTTVLGTSFTVKGYFQKEVTVELFEGSVQMSVKNKDEKWILEPGEKFIYKNEMALVTDFNRFVDFNDEKLSVVSAYIELNYGYKVAIPQEYSNQRITIRINKKEDLKTIVQLISEMYNLNFEANEKLKQITFQ